MSKDKNNKNRTEAYKGFELIWNIGLLQGKMVFVTLLFLFGLQILVFVIITSLFLEKGGMYYYFKYYCASIRSFFSSSWSMEIMYKGVNHQVQSGQLSEALLPHAQYVTRALGKYFIYSLLTYIFGFFAVRAYRKKALEMMEDKHIRGAARVTTEQLKKIISQDKKIVDIPLGELQLPAENETTHVFVVGRPGSGKTVCISQSLSRVRERGDKALVYDFQGDYLKWFYRPGDIIFNPLDQRCCNWSIFREIEFKPDPDEYAKSLIPDLAEAKDPYFNRAARQVFEGVLKTCIHKGRTTNKDIADMLGLPKDELVDALQGEGTADAIQHLTQDRTGDNVYSTVKTYTKIYQYLADNKGPDFSIKEWVEDEGDSRWVFLTSSQEYEETLKSIHTLFIDIASAKINSLSTDLRRRLFVVLDEFGTLQKLQSIKKLLVLSRKKGGSIWLGVQTTGQIEALYREDADAIIGSCATSVVFAVEDNRSAEYLSKKLGEAEVKQADESISMGPAAVRDGISVSQRDKVRRVIMPDEIRQLKELHAFVRFPGYPVSESKWQIRQLPEVAKELMLRDDLKITPRPAPQPQPVTDNNPNDPGPEDPGDLF